MNNKKSMAIEIMWLVLAIFGISLGVYKSCIIGFNDSISYFVIALISVVMYSMRRYIRYSSSKPDKN